MPSVFVSYRRSDEPGRAGRLYDRLVDRLGDANVFRDLDTMQPGADFAEVINRTVARCDALVAVIGPRWLVAEKDGVRRLEDPLDWVRLEIAEALKREIRVVPVLVGGASIPADADLPDDLKALARRHAVTISEEAWTAQVNGLIDALARPLAPPATEAASSHQAKVSDTPALSARVSELIRVEQTELLWSVAFAADDQRIATAGSDGTARVWDRKSGRELIRIHHDDMVQGVAFSCDCQRLATASFDQTARVWDSATGRELIHITHDGDVWAVAFSPDGKRVVTASDNASAQIWDSNSGRELIRVNQISGARVAFSPDGKRIATGSGDGTARVWHSDSGRELVRVDHNDGVVMGVAFSPDGMRIASASTGARVWDSDSGRELIRVGQAGAIKAVAFSPDGKRIATAGFEAGGGVSVWDGGNGRELARVSDEDYVTDVAFGHDGTRIVATSTRGAAVWGIG